MSETYSERTEKLTLLIGTMIGQISELLNTVGKAIITHDQIYKNLLDIHNAAALEIHYLYNKGNKP